MTVYRTVPVIVHDQDTISVHLPKHTVEVLARIAIRVAGTKDAREYHRALTKRERDYYRGDYAPNYPVPALESSHEQPMTFAEWVHRGRMKASCDAIDYHDNPYQYP